MEKFCQQQRLLIEEDGLVRVPFLVKGQLVAPPEVSRAEIEAAFAEASPGDNYRKLPQAQLLREPVIDRQSMKYSGQYLVQVMPPIQPAALIESDFKRLVEGPYALQVDQITEYLQTILRAMQANSGTVERALGLCLQTAEHPELLTRAAFASFQVGLDPHSARRMIDRELSAWQIPGSQFLDGWVELAAEALPGMTAALASGLPGAGDLLQPHLTGGSGGKISLRAMPTRQLHITAGNAPEVPVVSALRLILSKSAGVVKSPYGATLPGALLCLAAAAAAPQHPLTQHLSIVYWQGGDESIEGILLAPGAFDRVVVWGAPEAVSSVQSRALYTRLVSFNPRYGVSLIGRQAFAEDLDRVAFQAALDVMIYNQKSCTASHVQYVEGSPEQAAQYAERLAEMLRRWDELAPQFCAPAVRGQIKRMQRGKYARARWLTNTLQGEYSSGAVVLEGEFDLLDHPMSRLAVIRPVDDLRQALPYLHQGVSMAGVYPAERLQALRDEILGRGVSTALPLGECERIFPGAPQDGMMTLNQLVDWKVSV
jgi:hypothetical protein